MQVVERKVPFDLKIEKNNGTILFNLKFSISPLFRFTGENTINGHIQFTDGLPVDFNLNQAFKEILGKSFKNYAFIETLIQRGLINRYLQIMEQRQDFQAVKDNLPFFPLKVWDESFCELHETDGKKNELVISLQ